MHSILSAGHLTDNEISASGVDPYAMRLREVQEGPASLSGTQPDSPVKETFAHDRRFATTQEVLERLARIENALKTLVERQTIKDFYSTDEMAKILGKAEFTVREWCRRKRINAQKRHSGRGKFYAWVISHEELQRIQREGLLPEN